MKKNNKGFMLIEAIVTSTIIVTAMIGLYASFNKLYVNYNSKNQYYSIDAVYATKLMFQDMLDSGDINAIINNIFKDGHGEYLIYTNDTGTQCSVGSSCSQIASFYNIKNMILVEYDKESLKELQNGTLNETFNEYIDYVINYYNVTTSEEYDYLLLTEIYDGTDYYYANLRVR